MRASKREGRRVAGLAPATTAIAPMAFHRRRHQFHYQYLHRGRFLIPAISAISGALLLLFFFLSILAPSPIDENDHLRHRRQDSSVIYSPLSLPLSLSSRDAYHVFVIMLRHSFFFFLDGKWR